jgi:hypothetical protein
MTLKRDLSTRENREYWDYVQRASATVNDWPSWMKGQSSTVCDKSFEEDTIAQKREGTQFSKVRSK